MPKKYISSDLRAQVAKRARDLCEYCKSPKSYAPGPFDVEHILPLSLGATSILENLAYSCNGCNGHKYNKIEAIDPVENISVSLFHPRKNRWSAHFAWNEDASLIIGITPTGRATVDTLRLNRKEVVNLRTLLQLAGEHPPVED